MKKRKLVISFDSPAVLLFAGICLLALFLDGFTGGRSTAKVFSVYKSSMLDPMFYVRLFCHVFGHSGFGHLIGNLSLLLVIGPACEKRLGSWKLLLAFAVTALMSGIAHILISPTTMLLGASGVVYMLIFLSAVSGATDGEVPLTLILVGIMYIGQEVYGLFFNDDISQLTHIIGAVCGVLCGRLLTRR